MEKQARSVYLVTIGQYEEYIEGIFTDLKMAESICEKRRKKGDYAYIYTYELNESLSE